MSWDYLSPDQTYTINSIPTDYVWERLRHRRNQLLAASDYRMISDAPWDRAPWEAYRQALRDLPANTVDPRAAVWPEAPSE
jgi:hypothetical protein